MTRNRAYKCCAQPSVPTTGCHATQWPWHTFCYSTHCWAWSVQCQTGRSLRVSSARGRDCNARNVSVASSHIPHFGNTRPKCCDSLMDQAVAPTRNSHITGAGPAAGLARPDGCRISAGRTADCPGLQTLTLNRAETIVLAGGTRMMAGLRTTRSPGPRSRTRRPPTPPGRRHLRRYTQYMQYIQYIQSYRQIHIIHTDTYIIHTNRYRYRSYILIHT
jgi:hypothetical protein